MTFVFRYIIMALFSNEFSLFSLSLFYKNPLTVTGQGVFVGEKSTVFDFIQRVQYRPALGVGAHQIPVASTI